MSRTLRNLGLAALVAMGLAAPSAAMPASSRVTLASGKKIFVTGMNLAWINYANDVVNFDSATMAKAMKAVHDSGGNTMRIWLSTDGSKDPVFGADGYVSGPHANTIANIQKMLRIAKQNDMLLILCMMSHNFMNAANGANLANNHKMLQTDSGIAAYVDKWVIPVTRAIGADPNILCWEVFNEPEGMVLGWFSGQTIAQSDVQKVVNRVAGAIHRTVPKVLVSNGAVTLGFTSDVGGTNYYTDSALKAAGGDADGTLDFYMAHYYSSNGAGPSPFTKTFAYWNLDKPLVIAEYASEIFASEASYFGGATSVDGLLKYLDSTGYAGGLGWMYYENAGMAGFSAYGRSMANLYRWDSLSVKITGLSDNKFTVSVAATNGGTVKTSKVGRIDSLAVDTIIAVPMTGFDFAGWTGDTAAAGDTLVVVVNRDRMITANFKPKAGTNLIKNGDFAAGSANWGSLSLNSASGAAGTVDYTSGAAAISITSAGTLGWHVQLSQGDIAFDSGVTYVLSFDASASATRNINIDFSSGAGTNPAWQWLGGTTVGLTTASKTITTEVTLSGSSAAGVLQFGLGGATASVTIDNVSLVKKASSTGIHGGAVRSSAFQASVRGSRLAWIAPEALGSAGVLRVLDASGRELSRSSVAAGQSSGFVDVSGRGLKLVVLETVRGSWSTVVPSMR